jgi:hypothetical protein
MKKNALQGLGFFLVAKTFVQFPTAIEGNLRFFTFATTGEKYDQQDREKGTY